MNNYFETNIRPAVTVKPRPVELRIYYDPLTKICTHKTSKLDSSGDNYIVVDSNVYNSMDLCSNYKIVESKPVRIETVGKNYKNIVLDSDGMYSTVKNNMIFVVDSTYTGDVDRWSYGCK